MELLRTIIAEGSSSVALVADPYSAPTVLWHSPVSSQAQRWTIVASHKRVWSAVLSSVLLGSSPRTPIHIEDDGDDAAARQDSAATVQRRKKLRRECDASWSEDLLMKRAFTEELCPCIHPNVSSVAQSVVSPSTRPGTVVILGKESPMNLPILPGVCYVWAPRTSMLRVASLLPKCVVHSIDDAPNTP